MNQMLSHPLAPRHRVGPGRTHYGAHQEGEGKGSPGQVLPDGQGAGGRAFLTAEDTPSPSFRPGSSAKTHDLYFQSSGPIEPHREVDWSGWVGLTIPPLADQFQRPPLHPPMCQFILTQPVGPNVFSESSSSGVRRSTPQQVMLVTTIGRRVQELRVINPPTKFAGV